MQSREIMRLDICMPKRPETAKEIFVLSNWERQLLCFKLSGNDSITNCHYSRTDDGVTVYRVIIIHQNNRFAQRYYCDDID